MPRSLVAPKGASGLLPRVTHSNIILKKLVLQGGWLRKEPFSPEFVNASRAVCNAVYMFTSQGSDQMKMSMMQFIRACSPTVTHIVCLWQYAQDNFKVQEGGLGKFLQTAQARELPLHLQNGIQY